MATRMMRDLECMTYEEKLRQLGGFQAKVEKAEWGSVTFWGHFQAKLFHEPLKKNEQVSNPSQIK